MNKHTQYLAIGAVGALVGIVMGAGSMLSAQMVPLEMRYQQGAGSPLATRMQELQKRHVTTPEVKSMRLRNVPAVEEYLRSLEEPQEEEMRPAAEESKIDPVVCALAEDLVAVIRAELMRAIPDQYSNIILRERVNRVLDDTVVLHCGSSMKGAAPESQPTEEPVRSILFSTSSPVDNNCEQYISPRRKAQCEVYQRQGLRWE